MKIINRDVYRKFTIKDKITAGIVLTGPEVKSARLGHVDLSGSYVKIDKGQAELLGARISPYKFARPENSDPKRARKLLLNKQEIVSLNSKIENTSLTLVPIALYTIGAFFKLDIGIAKGKKKKDIREDLKKAAQQRDIETEMKRYQ